MLLRTGLRGVGVGTRLIPERSDEASSTLPPLEEEPQNSSYAAADGWDCIQVLGWERDQKRERRAS